MEESREHLISKSALSKVKHFYSKQFFKFCVFNNSQISRYDVLVVKVTKLRIVTIKLFGVQGKRTLYIYIYSIIEYIIFLGDSV